MKPKTEVGFTIIETMLFLGITGLLVVGILANTGVSINIQRYRDSVTSLQSILQQQYSDVSNVSNDSAGDLACYGDGSVKARGQSDCVLLGRFITTNDSRTLSIKNVIGFIPSGSTSSLNDVDVFLKDGDGSQGGYNIQVSPVDSDVYNIEWGASLINPVAKGGDYMIFSMLILRSPSSGVVRTFVDPDRSVADSKIQDFITQSALSQQSVKMCIDSNGLFSGGKSAVVVMPNTTSASGIETQGEVTSGC